MKTPTIALSVATIAVSVLLLSGCSAVNAISKAQSKVEACAAIGKQLTKVSSSISGLSTELSSDPKAGAKDVTTIANSFSASVAKLHNEQVKAAGTKAADSLTKFAKDLTSFAANPSTTSEKAFQADSAPLTTNLTAIGKTCKV